MLDGVSFHDAPSSPNENDWRDDRQTGIIFCFQKTQSVNVNQPVIKRRYDMSAKTYKAFISRLGKMYSVLMILVMLVSLVGISPVSAAPKDTALQFDGTNDHVAFGDTRMTSGTLTNTPTWNSAANSKWGASSLTFLNTSSEYVTFGNAPELGLTNFTVETWFYRTAAGGTILPARRRRLKRDTTCYQRTRRGRLHQRGYELLPRHLLRKQDCSRL